MKSVSSIMSRRRVLKGAGVAVATSMVSFMPEVIEAQEESPKLKGRIRQSTTRWPLGKKSIQELCVRMRQLGLVGLDLAGNRQEWPIIKEHGLVVTMAPGAGGINDGLNNRDKHPDFLRNFRDNIKAAAQFGWQRVITMAGSREKINDQDGMAACETILKEAVKIAADNHITICMELLNSKVDHPDYMCDNTAWGVELCKRVASPHFKLLYDIYHMQVMEGDIIRTIRDNIDYIGHFHTAGNPGRKDLDEEQELHYPAIMRAIAKLQEEGKFNGYVAHEFGPKHGVESLRRAIALCDV